MPGSQSPDTQTVIVRTGERQYALEQPHGLDSPRLQIMLLEDPADLVQEVIRHVLLFGNDAADQPGVYVRLATQPTVYLIDGSEAQRLMGTTAFNRRNKKILAFDAAAVGQIRLHYPTSVLSPERRGGAWEISAPERQTVRQGWKVDNLLDELSALEYVRIIAEPFDSGEPYGLQTPQAVATGRYRYWPLVIGHAANATAEADTRPR